MAAPEFSQSLSMTSRQMLLAAIAEHCYKQKSEHCSTEFLRYVPRLDRSVRKVSFYLSAGRQRLHHHQVYGLDGEIPLALRQIDPSLTLSDLPSLLMTTRDGGICFDDSWTVYFWSLWWSSFGVGRKPDEVVVLHLDSHQDLLPPRAHVREGNWHDDITGDGFALDRPDSIAAAIQSGAIDIGSFILPFAREIPSMTMRHLVPQLSPGQSSSAICRVSAGNTTGRIVASDQPDHPCALAYSCTSDKSAWLSGVSRGTPVLLHIDLDFFNNRFDGGSQSAVRRHDPGLSEMTGEVNSVCEALQAGGLAENISNITIALSPGFFPSEYWSDVLNILRSKLRSIGCRCP